MAASPELADRIRELLVEALRLDGLDPFAIDLDSPLFGEGLGLDSVDALELVVALEREFGIAIPSVEVDQQSFGSLANVVSLVERLERDKARRG